MKPLYLLHMTKVYGNDIVLDGKPWSRYGPGDTDNAVEEWQQNLIAVVAGMRFHHPTSGIGLCVTSKNCIRATRKVETKLKFWDVESIQELLSNRQPDEAYLAADPGKAFILYFANNGGGSAGLKLDPYPGKTFELRWISIDTGNWGTKVILLGGNTVMLDRPFFTMGRDYHQLRTAIKGCTNDSTIAY